MLLIIIIAVRRTMYNEHMIRMVLIRTLSRMKTIRISRNGQDKNATVLNSIGNGESGCRFGRDSGSGSECGGSGLGQSRFWAVWVRQVRNNPKRLKNPNPETLNLQHLQTLHSSLLLAFKPTSKQPQTLNPKGGLWVTRGMRCATAVAAAGTYSNAAATYFRKLSQLPSLPACSCARALEEANPKKNTAAACGQGRCTTYSFPKSEA